MAKKKVNKSARKKQEDPMSFLTELDKNISQALKDVKVSINIQTNPIQLEPLGDAPKKKKKVKKR